MPSCNIVCLNAKQAYHIVLHDASTVNYLFEKVSFVNYWWIGKNEFAEKLAPQLRFVVRRMFQILHVAAELCCQRLKIIGEQAVPLLY